MKTKLRKEFKQIRNQIVAGDDMVLKFAINLCNVLNNYINSSSGVISIGVYESLPGEVPVEKILKALSDLDKNLYSRLSFFVPKVISDGHMIFADRDNKNKPAIPEIIIIPMIAFDDNLCRLGYGGGFYDIYLEKFMQNIRCSIGVAYQVQKSEVLFGEAHDIPLDVILTEDGVVKKRLVKKCSCE